MLGKATSGGEREGEGGPGRKREGREEAKVGARACVRAWCVCADVRVCVVHVCVCMCVCVCLAARRVQAQVECRWSVNSEQQHSSGGAGRRNKALVPS